MTDKPFVMMAPMEGVIDFYLRKIYSRIGGYDRFVTEFVRVTDRPVTEKVLIDYCPELKTNGQTAEGIPVYVQLLGGQPIPIAESAELAVRLGAPGIDLNFGCPAKTVNRHDGGASLLKNPHRLYDVVSAVRKIVPASVPVTAKVRLGFDNKNYVKEIALAVKEANASQITIHARTRDEGYRPPAHWEYIALMRETVAPFSVIANGEIWNAADCKKCLEVTGCDAVAIGRGAIANPFLANDIKNGISTSIKNGISNDSDKIDWKHFANSHLKQFVLDCTNSEGPAFGASRSKQWIKFLGRHYPEAIQVFEHIKTLKSGNDVAAYLLSDQT
jgi:tRNA-dihydrouridine synthase C